MISYLCQADMPRRIESTIRGRSRVSNVPPVTEIVGQVDDVTTATDVSIIKLTTEISLAAKAATI